MHPDTLRDELRRIEERSWARLQELGVQALYARQLVRGQVYAIDGSGLGADLRLVALVCVSGARPAIVAWRLLTGSASEKGKEAGVTKALVEQALALGGPGCIRLLLADGLYADGPLLAWLKYVHGIDALVRLPSERLLYQQLQQLAGLEGAAWREHRYVRTMWTMLRSVVIDAWWGWGHLEDDADLLVVHVHAPHEGQDKLPLQGAVGVVQTGADPRCKFP